MKAHAVTTSLLLLTGLLSLLFLGKAEWLGQERITHHRYQQSLGGKLKLFDYLALDADKVCQTVQKNRPNYPLASQQYGFHCEFHSLFFTSKPSKEKFILATKPEQWLDLDQEGVTVYPIRTLAELPPSSEQFPKIVRTLNEIDERLTHDFYGIVIADYAFNFTDKKIFGTIYSPLAENERNRRNHSFKRQVIDNLEQHYSRWVALPYSRHTLINDETP